MLISARLMTSLPPQGEKGVRVFSADLILWTGAGKEGDKDR